MGVDIFEPESKREESLAQALEDFSRFVLHDESDLCQKILLAHLGESVGELQGGSEEHEIYRVSIPQKELGESTNSIAAMELLREFNSSCKQKNELSYEKLVQYMLGMCDRRSQKRGSRKCTKLGNLMFILTFGQTHGQVMHIDQMDPNVQICLYMSPLCPSTTVYSMEGESFISNATDLVEHWGLENMVPDLVKTTLLEHGDSQLGQKGKHSGQYNYRYFSYWETINTHLKVFGRLYQPVAWKLSLQTDPGTTLIADGNGVHSGPPTERPRMFAFAIGIPEEGVAKGCPDNTYGEHEINDESKDGEVQYNPVLLHADLCCILFSRMMEPEYTNRRSEIDGAKRFLLSMLVDLAGEYPNETYARLLGDDRSELRDWLGRLVAVLREESGRHASSPSMRIQLLVQEAIDSDSLVFCPGDTKSLKKRRAKAKKKRSAIQ